MSKRTLAEQETVVRFDRASSEAVLWTADQGQARRWERKGYAVQAESGGWRCTVHKRLISFRREKPSKSPGHLTAESILAASC